VPILLGGTNIVLATSSFGANSICSGNTYSYRVVDTEEALGWITATIRGSRRCLVVRNRQRHVATPGERCCGCATATLPRRSEHRDDVVWKL